MRRFVQVMFFLALVDEGRSLYKQYFFITPFGWVHSLLFEAIASIRPYDVAMLVALLMSTGGFRTRTTPALKRTMLGAVFVIFVGLSYGVGTGGDGRAAGWQVYLPLSMILTAFAIAATHQTAEHFASLFKGFVAAGVVHAIMCLLFMRMYFGWIYPPPEYCTTHDDTILWTSSVWLLLLAAALFPNKRTKRLAWILVPLVLLAIQFNKRRMAWVSLVGAGIAAYFVLPDDKLKRRIRRGILIAAPIIAIYTAVGWGSSNPIFIPLRSFSTVSVDQDKSTKARNMENLGLIATANQYGPLMGSGWGHKYVEVSSLYKIYFFELWPYVPHNSVLGLLAYSGYVGFVGFWMMVPMAAFFHARVAREAARPMDRFIATISLVQLVACADQWYGDMGAFSPFTMYTLASALAAGLRLPAASGVFPALGGARKARPPQPARARA